MCCPCIMFIKRLEIIKRLGMYIFIFFVTLVVVGIAATDTTLAAAGIAGAAATHGAWRGGPATENLVVKKSGGGRVARTVL